MTPYTLTCAACFARNRMQGKTHRHHGRRPSQSPDYRPHGPLSGLREQGRRPAVYFAVKFRYRTAILTCNRSMP